MGFRGTPSPVYVVMAMPTQRDQVRQRTLAVLREWSQMVNLERRDVDLEAGALSVERVYSQGRLKDCAKSNRQRRRVPLRQRVVEAIRALPPRVDTPLQFPAARGGYIDGECFRYRHWSPALRAAGIAHRRVYDARHTFASWAIAGGVQLFYLARIMGTSVAQIDATYGHLLPDSEEYLRGLLDDYDQVSDRRPPASIRT